MFHFNNLNSVKIVSMTPANPGWFLRVKENASDTEWWYQPVACWAHCRFKEGEMILPCVPDENGCLIPNDPDSNPCDLVYLPKARPVENKHFGNFSCELMQ